MKDNDTSTPPEMTAREIEALLAKPTISPDELFRSRIFPLSRNGIYEAIKRGDLQVVPIGRKKAIITARLRKQLGIDDESLASIDALLKR